MKKQLFTIFGAVAVSAIVAQTPSPSWPTQQNTNFTLTSASIKYLDVVNSSVIWGIGYSGAAGSVSRNYNDFTRSTDGGLTFVTGNVYPDTNTYHVANIEAIDANTAWVGSFLNTTQNKGAIHRTTNGGLTWVNLTPAPMFTNTSSFNNFVSFLTPSIGITVGDPVGGEYEIWRTTDAGSTWNLIPGTSIPNPTTAEFALVNLYTKVGTSNFWFGTNKGRIFRSTDAGITWSATQINSLPIANAQVIDLAFTSPSQGLVSIVNGTTLELWNTTDGGVTFTQIPVISPNFGRNDFAAVPGTNYFVSAANTAGTPNTGLSYSSDNGVTWTSWGSDAIGYTTIDFADANSGWASTFQSSPTPTTGGIYKYTGVGLTGTVAPTAAFFAPPTACTTSTLVLTNVSTGSATPSYTWTSAPPGVIFSSSTAVSPTISFAGVNSYTITLLASNLSGTNSTSQIVNVVNCVSPTASFTIPTGTLCNKAAINFTNTSTGTPTPIYSWSVSPATNVTIAPTSFATNAAISFSTPGIYSVTLLATNVNGTSSITQTVNITSCIPNVGFTIPSTANTCTDTPFTATNTTTGNNGGINYLWTLAPTGTGATFNPGATTSFTLAITFSVAGTYTLSLNATNASGSASTSKTISVSACTGINETNLLANNVKLFPNPTKDIITLSLPNQGIDYNVTITDILGSAIYSQKIAKNNSDVQINLANKAKGVYFITIEGNNQKATKKIIVD